MAGRASVNSDTSPGTLWTWPDISRGGHVARRDALGVGPACACAAPPLGPKTTQPRLGQKPSPGRLPPVLPSVKGDPFTDGRTGGSSQWRGRDGGVCGFAATRASCSHPGPLCPCSMEEVGRLWRDAGVLRGSRDGVGTPRAREGTRDPREHPGKCPALAPVAPVASLGSCRGAWSRSPGPRFSAGECLLRTARTTGRGCLHGEGGSSSVGPGSQRTQSLLAKSSPDFRE